MRLGVEIGRELMAFARECRDRLKEEYGLIFHPSTNADEFMRVVAAIRDEITNLTTPFHPSHCVLDPNHFWWSRLADEQGSTVGFTSHRLIETDDFVEDYALGRVFADNAPNMDIILPSLVGNPNIPTISGRIVFAGGLWVKESRRDTGIVRTYSPMGQALSLLRFKWDQFVILQRFVDGEPPRLGYGFNRSEHLSTGTYWPYGEELDIGIAWKDRQEFIEAICGRK